VTCIAVVVLLLAGGGGVGFYYLKKNDDKAKYGFAAIRAALPVGLRTVATCTTGKYGSVNCAVPAGNELIAGLMTKQEAQDGLTIAAEIEHDPAEDARNLRAGSPYIGELVDNGNTIYRIPANGADAGFEYLNVRSGLHLSATYLANIAAVKTFITRAGL
jgi:hypothetical protein